MSKATQELLDRILKDDQDGAKEKLREILIQKSRDRILEVEEEQ